MSIPFSRLGRPRGIAEAITGRPWYVGIHAAHMRRHDRA
jgi:hypothetical protein